MRVGPWVQMFYYICFCFFPPIAQFAYFIFFLLGPSDLNFGQLLFVLASFAWQGAGMPKLQILAIFICF